MTDKTNFAQSLMHIIKGNLGTGILAMPASFAHTGLMTGIIGLPILCLVATYCVHLLVRSSQHLESKMKWVNMEYAELAKGSFKAGPGWMKPWSGFMCRVTDTILIVSQLGICCVYIVFVVDNIVSILTTYNVQVSHIYVFAAVLPVILLLSYIRTLKKLSIASACANVLQAAGIGIILQYLVRELPEDLNVTWVKPVEDVALGFGSAMFAFEGISVILPIYTKMKRPEQMGGCFGLINLSYLILLILYFSVGVMGYLKYGDSAAGSITLNLPKEPLYDVVRAIFTASLFLTYPLQFYVPNTIIWNWAKSQFLIDGSNKDQNSQHTKYDYLCRTILVLFTFILAVTVPKLNLMMDLVGSISGTALSIILPPVIHIATFWEDTSGVSKAFMIVVDSVLIMIGLIASASGSYVSLVAIISSFSNEGLGSSDVHVST